MICIPLSKTGKHKGKYEAIVSDEDSDLAEFNWSVAIPNGCTTQYATREFCKKNFLLHRVVLERIIYPLKLQKGDMVDHINGNGLDNRRENLRVATKSQNMANRSKPINSKSGFKGVTWNKQRSKWTAQITYNYKHLHLGLFNTPEEAHAVYCAKANELFGDFWNEG